MIPIKGKLISPYQAIEKTIIKGEGWNSGIKKTKAWKNYDATVNKIRASNGYPVKTYRELMNKVADITLGNKEYEMFFRGQEHDYRSNSAKYYKDHTPKTIIFPTICRPERSISGSYKYSIKQSQITRRYNNLSKAIRNYKGRESYFKEYYYALFQHYGVLPTPLIDITQSLRVAATFAFAEQQSEKGYLYVFGLPYSNQSISYYSDLQIVLLKLQNVCPTRAKRPRYQEGFLVGKFPIRASKTIGDNLANRLVAKFLLDNSQGNFWDNDFRPLPKEILRPDNDKIEIELMQFKNKLEKVLML